MLQEFISLHRDEIIKRCRAKVATRSIPPPTETEIDHGVPLFLAQLVEMLHVGEGSTAEISRSAVLHGHDLLIQGYTVSQVVHDYGDVCQSITELGMETSVPIGTDDFHTLNRCLDDAIAGAVTEYGRQREQMASDEESVHAGDRLGYFSHELRNLTNTAILAFEVLKTGNVGVGGSTGTVLHRKLLALRALINRSLAEVRMTQGVENRERIIVADFIGELVPTATLEAEAKGLTFTVMLLDDTTAIEAGRQVLTAVVGNLLQNAFKFTRPSSTVTLRVVAADERVLIEIHDECGGLPNGSTDALFRPFEQRANDRTGLGLGLAFSRWGAKANNGTISTRNVPGKGCVFIVDLPRAAAAVLSEPGLSRA